MDNTGFLSQITLNTVGPVRNCAIALSKNERRHLILTGRNGSGKTAVLQAVRDALQPPASRRPPLTLTFEHWVAWQTAQQDNACIMAYYPASFRLAIEAPKGTDTLELPCPCAMNDRPGQWFLQHLVNVHAEKTLARNAGRHERVKECDSWLTMLDHALQGLFHDSTLTVRFHHQASGFTLVSQQYGSRDFSQLSDGQSRVLSIFCDLLMRMKCLKSTEDNYDFPGIVLIDGLENSLHTEVQKRILPFLVDFFPNVQFFVSTHSPFIINSLDTAVVFDLDRHSRLNDVLKYPYEAIIERCDLSKYSEQIKQLLGEYEKLLNKQLKTEHEGFRLLELGDYLAWVLTKFRQGNSNNP